MKATSSTNPAATRRGQTARLVPQSLQYVPVGYASPVRNFVELQKYIGVDTDDRLSRRDNGQLTRVRIISVAVVIVDAVCAQLNTQISEQAQYL